MQWGVDVEIDDICEFVDFGLDYDTGDETASTLTASTTNAPAQQPVINIINSNVTFSNERSRNVVYDEDNLEFIFEEPDASVDYDDMPELNFDEIVEI